MILNELKEYLKKVWATSKDKKISQFYNIEYRTDEDELYFDFIYNYDKQRYECYVSVYHASEDNNAENVEAHTDENTYWNTDLELLINELTEEYGNEFLEKA